MLNINQSNISRNLCKSIRLLTSLGVWAEDEKSNRFAFQDTHEILKSQRKIHQRIRFIQGKQLRVQATCWGRHLLLEPTPEGWIANQGDIKCFRHCETLQLLEERIIDAALASNPEAPPESDRRFTRYHLSNQPLFLLLAKANPLAREQGLSATEVIAGTELGYSSFVSKECRATMKMLDQKLFGAQYHQPIPSNKEPPIHARRYGTAMTTMIRPDLTKLDFNMSFSAGDILVVKRDLAEHPEIIFLVHELKRRLHLLQHKITGLEILC